VVGFFGQKSQLMAKKSTWVQLDKRKLELSNLEKILFPEDHISKAQVIEYYLAVAPTLLRHVKGRALTLIRFPEGIHGEQFYQKNRPEWAPPWLEFEKLGTEEKKDYIIATEPASIVWMANLAALELHQLHARRPHLVSPDYMVFDLDPPEGFDFAKLVPIAFQLKDHIEKFGYTPFVKTTGGKGLHICCPLLPQYPFSEVFEAAQRIAQLFVETHGSMSTLHIKKEARKGRVLIDIYRIRSGQSIVSPYSLRGRPGAPVSMPLVWEELEKVTSPLQFNLTTAVSKLQQDGDPWEAIDAYAAELHTQRSVHQPLSTPEHNRAKTKTPDQLKAYARKRDFSKTPEPMSAEVVPAGNRFVVHRHHASHLHYDLRLEKDGVLKSWAVPKGLPPLPGIKRLAVQTEDHPIEYLTFDGIIPKGQYGAGEMWIYANGTYTITKEKKDGFYFRLHSKAVSAEYRIYQLQKEKEWLLERVDQPQVNYLSDAISPMLASVGLGIPSGDRWRFEIKWDGVRVMVALQDGQIRLRTRNQMDVTHAFPELTSSEHFRASSGLFDGEIVCLDAGGKPVFNQILKRTMAGSAAAAEKLARQYPVHCYLFDVLHLDGRALIQEPLQKRSVWLRDSIKPQTPYRISEMLEDGQALWEAAKVHELEGIIAKRMDSSYWPGKRTDSWLKIKVRNTLECFIVGYSPGNGERKALFGGLHLAEQVDGKFIYRGKVGTGFDEAMMKLILQELQKLPVVPKPFPQKILDEKISIWIKPELVAEISYSRMTNDQLLREPVFLKLRLDL
jgi:DNA ligase D-like protein (predicted ligase)/DNA ligase D-like protein (predicted polymerase)/DNA ligase D-like protein (predicted 3'-phosphoesterase)